MSNDSRSLVVQTLSFSEPSRIPRNIWILPWAQLNHPEKLAQIQKQFPQDIIGAPLSYSDVVAVTGNPYAVGSFIDEWGCEFENKQAGIIGEVKRPIIESYDVPLRTPDALLSLKKDDINNFCRCSDKFVLASCCPRPFERIQFLRGTVDVMMDIAMAEPAFLDLLHKVHSFYIKELELWAQTEVDALRFMDDWGSQLSLLINPETWRKVFKPLYKDYIDIAKRYGKFIFMHSDGFIIDIIPDLIELGLDALNSQIFCMGIEKLEQFKGKITFWGEIDRQQLLPFASESEIRNAVQKVYSTLYDHGGLIAQCEFGPGARPENVYTVFDEWNNLGSSRIV